MDDLSDGSCRPEFGFPKGVGLNANNEICFYEVTGGGDGQGGGPLGIGQGGGGSAAQPAPTAPPVQWQKPEKPIETSGTAPICDRYHPCTLDPITGFRDSLRAKADETGRGRKSTSRGNAKGKKRPRPAKLTADKAECDGIKWQATEQDERLVILIRRHAWAQENYLASRDLNNRYIVRNRPGDSKHAARTREDREMYRNEMTRLGVQIASLQSVKREWTDKGCGPPLQLPSDQLTAKPVASR